MPRHCNSAPSLALALCLAAGAYGADLRPRLTIPTRRLTRTLGSALSSRSVRNFRAHRRLLARGRREVLELATATSRSWTLAQAIQALRGPHADAWVTRQVAVEALGQIGGDDARAALIAALRGPHADEDGLVRIIAAGALGQVGGDDATAALIAALRGPQKDGLGVRCAAVEALGQIGGDDARAALIAALRGPEPDFSDLVRGRAAEVLGRVGGGEAKAALIAAVWGPRPDPDQEVVKEARVALVRIEHRRDIVADFWSGDTSNGKLKCLGCFKPGKLNTPRFHVLFNDKGEITGYGPK